MLHVYQVPAKGLCGVGQAGYVSSHVVLSYNAGVPWSISPKSRAAIQQTGKWECTGTTFDITENTEVRIDDPILKLVTMLLVLILLSSIICVWFYFFSWLCFHNLLWHLWRTLLILLLVLSILLVFRLSSQKFRFASKFYLPWFHSEKKQNCFWKVSLSVS